MFGCFWLVVDVGDENVEPKKDMMFAILDNKKKN
jgi:hypothetical protein